MSFLFKKNIAPVATAEPEVKHLPMLVQVALSIPGENSIDRSVVECSRVLSIYDCHQVNLVATTNGDPDGCYSLNNFFTDNAEINDILVKLDAKICRNGDELYVSTRGLMFKRVDFTEKLYREYDGQNICFGTIIKMNLGMNKN